MKPEEIGIEYLNKKKIPNLYSKEFHNAMKLVIKAEREETRKKTLSIVLENQTLKKDIYFLKEETDKKVELLKDEIKVHKDGEKVKVILQGGKIGRDEVLYLIDKVFKGDR